MAHLLLGNHTTDPYIKMPFLFGGQQVGGVSVLDGETPAVFLPCHCLTDVVTFPALDTLQRKIPSSQESCLRAGLPLLSPLTELALAVWTSRHISAGRPGLCHLMWKSNPNSWGN